MAQDSHLDGTTDSTPQPLERETPGLPEREEPRPPTAKRPRAARIIGYLRTHRRFSALALLALALLCVAAYLLLRYLASFESTDDAQVDGNISSIGTRIAGTVIAVYVDDNTRVRAGDPLVDLDPADYRVALDQAAANLAQAESQVRGSAPSVPITTVTNQTSITTALQDVTTAQADLNAVERDYQTSVARLNESTANNSIAQVDLTRSRRLVETGAVSKEDYDQHKATADAREAEVAAARATVESSQRHIEESRSRLVQARSRLVQVERNAPEQLEATSADLEAREGARRAAKAALDQASLNLGYTSITAPVAGIVGQKSANVGDRVQPAQGLLSIVQVDNLWITANYKETQLVHMRPGQRADIHVDALAATFRGTVESLPGASGARFSLLPPENATGNYVKVVQRLPVRIRLDRGQPDLDRLRPGMSVEPKVWLR